jgi:predicted acyl esterase
MNVRLDSTLLFSLVLGVLAVGARADQPASAPDAERVQVKWGVKIPLRDGVKLDATVYTPRQQNEPAPCIFTLTPYTAQSYHDRVPWSGVRVRGDR